MSDIPGTVGTRGGKASHELTSRKRQSSGLCRAVPPMVSSVCEEPARSEVELERLWLHTRWEGWATATPTEGQPAFLQLCWLQGHPHATGHAEPHSEVAVTLIQGHAAGLGSVSAPHFCPCANGWRFPDCLSPTSLGTGTPLHCSCRFGNTPGAASGVLAWQRDMGMAKAHGHGKGTLAWHGDTGIAWGHTCTHRCVCNRADR